MKVLHIITDLSVGGAEMMLYRLLGAMNEEGFGSAVLSLKEGGRLRERVEMLGVPVYTLGLKRPSAAPASVWELSRLLRRVRPDVIQGWMYHGNLAAQLAGAIASPRASVIWNIRQSLYSLDSEKPATAMAIKLGAALSGRPAGIIYNSRAGAAQHAAFGFSDERSLVIHNGFDTDLFAPSDAARRSVRSELGVAEDAVLIGLVSRYHSVKGHSDFLKAAALLLAKYPGARFVLCGRGVGWDNRPLRELIQALALTGSVHLLGERGDAERIIAALDVAASASHGEGFPNAVGEAMSCAVPCVVTDVSEVPWIVEGAGRVVPAHDPHSMALALAEVLGLGRAGREALGRAGRARVMKYFRLDSVAAQYCALYRSAAARAESQAAAVRPRRAWGQLLTKGFGGRMKATAESTSDAEET